MCSCFISVNDAVQTRLFQRGIFRVRRCCERKTISLGLAFNSFTISFIEVVQFRTIFAFVRLLGSSKFWGLTVV